MDSKASIALNQFARDFDTFLDSCDDLENSGAWDVHKLGPMATYFEADLFAVMLQVMCADGVFEHSETEVLNAMLGTDYTPRQLNDLYKSAKPVASAYVDEDAEDALALLATVSPNMYESYRDLLLEACRIVSLSDGTAEKSERMLIAQIREALS